MYVELLSRIGLGRKKDTAPYDPTKDITLIRRFSILDRKEGLICLLRATQTLDKDQVGALANGLYQDAISNRIRPLYQSATAAGLLAGKDYLRKNPFLNHVALSYSQAEMAQPMRFKPLTGFGGIEQSLGFIDMLSGGGPPRPLLYDLYMLEGLGEVRSDQTPCFWLTSSGAEFADTIDLNFQHVVEYEGKHNFMVVLGPQRATIRRAENLPD